MIFDRIFVSIIFLLCQTQTIVSFSHHIGGFLIMKFLPFIDSLLHEDCMYVAMKDELSKSMYLLFK
jgi:hypothetical protein